MSLFNNQPLPGMFEIDKTFCALIVHRCVGTVKSIATFELYEKGSIMIILNVMLLCFNNLLEFLTLANPDHHTYLHCSSGIDSRCLRERLFSWHIVNRHNFCMNVGIKGLFVLEWG